MAEWRNGRRTRLVVRLRRRNEVPTLRAGSIPASANSMSKPTSLNKVRQR